MIAREQAARSRPSALSCSTASRLCGRDDVGHRQQSQISAARGDQQRRLALGAQRVDCRSVRWSNRRLRDSQQPFVADQYLAAVRTRRRIPWPGTICKSSAGTNVSPPLLRPRDDRLGQRMLAQLFHCGGRGQQILGGHAGRRHDLRHAAACRA